VTVSGPGRAARQADAVGPGDSARVLASLAQRVVRAAVSALAAATIAATVVGFWLSYAGLHSFAVRSGLRGPEAWAWPASVDLFILAGELGVTISAIRRQRDPLAWCYLLAGFGPSVAFNVLHVATVTPPWGRYAVAAVPPVAAMLALAALMRQVFKLAVDAHLAITPAAGKAPAAAPAVRPRSASRSAPAKRSRRTRKTVTADDAEMHFAGELAAGQVPSARRIGRELHVGQPRAQEIRDHLAALAPAVKGTMS
jgi:hypothetical protein